MPFFSDLSNSNMYYSGLPSYSAPSYGYSSSSLPLGGSYSASYLNPGGSYSSHSSLGSYSRAPFTPRWTPTVRNYSPILSTISERGLSSPLRVNSPRRLPLTKKSYSPSYTPRPININTADIDVSRDKYRPNHTPSRTFVTPVKNYTSTTNSSTRNNDHDKDNGPFMPRVDGKPETGIDSSPGQRSTIRRGRTVVRLHTIKRRERDSPRKPQDSSTVKSDPLHQDKTDKNMQREKNYDLDAESQKGAGWREKLSEDLVYKDKRGKKSLGEKLVEKFKLRDKIDNDVNDITKRDSFKTEVVNQNVDNNEICATPAEPNIAKNRSPDRRCSMELLAEQANVLDSLIRGENLSTATLDLSKVGTNDDKSRTFKYGEYINRPLENNENRLQTTKSDHSLHKRIKSLKDSKESQQLTKRSLKKSSSGGSICRLDSITEFAKEPLHIGLPAIEENRSSIKVEPVKSKPKLKPKITSTIEVSQPKSPIKFRVENVTVEEKIREHKKEIIFSSTVENPPVAEMSVESNIDELKDTKMSHKVNQKTAKVLKTELEKSDNIESDSDNFWDKIGKRETVYLKNRQEKIQDDLVKNRREMYWYPEEEESGTNIDQDDFKVDTQDIIINKVLDVSRGTSPNNKPSLQESITTIEAIDLTTSNMIDASETNYIERETPNPPIQVLSQEKKSNDQTIPGRNIEEFKDQPETVTDDVVQEQLNEIAAIKNNGESIQTKQDLSSSTTSFEKIIKEVGNSDKNKNKVQFTAIVNTSVSVPDNSKICLQKETILYKDIIVPEKKYVNITVFDVQSQKATIEFIEHTKNSPEKKKDSPNIEKTLASPQHTKNSPGKKKDSANIEKTLASPQAVVDVETTSETIKVEDVINNEKNTEINQNCVHSETTVEDVGKMDMPQQIIHAEKQDIPNENNTVRDVNIGEDNKAENEIPESISLNADASEEQSEKDLIKLPASPKKKKPVKEEAALKPLIATPRPLQKKAPQVIHSSSSSESSSEEDSSDDDDADESDNSEGSTQFFDCETNPDGRTSTGSNDSGFDSSAPTSPAAFTFIKKGGDSPGASGSGGASSKPPATDILEQELESSTAYGLFRKTGHFTPPARTIPRFRKYTIEDFHFIKVLGKGSFGKVLLAELRDTEYYYAVKCLKKDVVLEDDDVECTLIERKVLALGTNHPYLCHLFATFQTDSHLFFVMEYLNGGDLMFHIQQSGRFPEVRARFYAAEIVSGLKFLHKRGIVYRDLKLDNILLDYDGHVRIADFGMCKLQIYLEKTADTFCGTPDYMAPEIIKGLKYNQAVDWWSFGVLLYEMLIGQSPFSGCDEDELFWSICNEMPSYPRFLSTDALNILTRLLDKDARTRLGGAECMHGDIREQEFFRPIHWERLERRDLESPFKPHVRHPLDTQYFDRAFTGERPRLTAVEPQVLRSMDQEPFRGFSYTNPNATDR